MDEHTKNLQQWVKWADTVVCPTKKDKFRWLAEEDLYVPEKANIVLDEINAAVRKNMYEESFKSTLTLDRSIGEQLRYLDLDYREGEIWQAMTYSFWLYLNHKYVNLAEVADHIKGRRKPKREVETNTSDFEWIVVGNN